METTEYSKDKNAVFRWIISGIGIACITIMGGIYNKMDSFATYMIKSGQDIDYIKEKNKEQDRRLDIHENILYLKPEDLQFKPNQK